MQLSIQNDHLRIDLSFWERFWAFFFNQTLEIPLDHIQRVTTEKPASSWKDMRLPGTSLPGIMKAGTYYSDRGREFWYVKGSDRFLALELEDEFYKRIVLTIEDNQDWAERLEHHPASRI
jgi:ssDNA-binding replication factor A large subunit